QDTIAYYKEFEKEKIVYPDIATVLSFILDKHNMFMNNTCYFLNFGEINKYAISILNSIIIDWYFRGISAQLGNKALRHFNIYVENLPIPKIPRPQQIPFENLVDCILFAKEHNMESEASLFESVIDGMVYDLYFADDMKTANCYITDRIAEILSPFPQDENDKSKTGYINRLHNLCKTDKIISSSLANRKKIRVVEIVEGRG
ncbi:MAG: TaqI-like C-terminal specificity domain-containing protein, partial [Nitrospirota bacterium]